MYVLRNVHGGDTAGQLPQLRRRAGRTAAARRQAALAVPGLYASIPTREGVSVRRSGPAKPLFRRAPPYVVLQRRMKCDGIRDVAMPPTTLRKTGIHA